MKFIRVAQLEEANKLDDKKIEYIKQNWKNELLYRRKWNERNIDMLYDRVNGSSNALKHDLEEAFHLGSISEEDFTKIVGMSPKEFDKKLDYMRDLKKDIERLEIFIKHPNYREDQYIPDFSTDICESMMSNALKQMLDKVEEELKKVYEVI